MKGRFKVVVPSFNSIDYIENSLHSIEIQDFKDFDACIIDDCSTIPRQREIILDFCKRNGWLYLFNDKNYGALYGLKHAIDKLECLDDDVIIIVDGDDWLANTHVLSRLKEIYSESDILFTWGQCESYPPGKTPMKFAQPVPDMVIEQKLFREIPYVFRHLLSFKFLLWRQIKDKDLRDVNGEYFRILYDHAIYYPMLEMAGKKIRYIDETLYIYNLQNPLNDYATTPRDEFQRVKKLIQSMPKYETLEFCQ